MGKPVVPDVYRICAASRGLTSGSCTGGPAMRNSASWSPISTTSRMAGSSATTRSDRRHQVAAILGHQEQADSARLFKHIFQFATPIARIDRDKHNPGQRQAKFRDDPFRRIGRPDGNPLTGCNGSARHGRADHHLRAGRQSSSVGQVRPVPRFRPAPAPRESVPPSRAAHRRQLDQSGSRPAVPG